jgi:hypothetical protein
VVVRLTLLSGSNFEKLETGVLMQIEASRASSTYHPGYVPRIAMAPNSSSRLPSLAATLLLFLSGTAVIQAQVDVSLELNRSTYVSHEPIKGKLTLINRAGQDIILGDSGGLGWLDYSVTDNRGNLVVPTASAANETPIVLASGKTYVKEVTINQYYPMSTIGAYRVKATVTLGQMNRVFQTTPVTVQVTSAQPMWSQIVGVPAGHPRAGTYRKYELMTFYHGARGKSLFFRVSDSDSEIVYRTYPIGDYMTVYPPEKAIDSQNQLHVLHMTGPAAYKYTVIDIDGYPVKQQNFFEKKNIRPTLKTSEFGEVTVLGGITEEEAGKPYEETQFRRLSERPPGLPQR